MARHSSRVAQIFRSDWPRLGNSSLTVMYKQHIFVVQRHHREEYFDPSRSEPGRHLLSVHRGECQLQRAAHTKVANQNAAICQLTSPFQQNQLDKNPRSSYGSWGTTGKGAWHCLYNSWYKTVQTGLIESFPGVPGPPVIPARTRLLPEAENPKHLLSSYRVTVDSLTWDNRAAWYHMYHNQLVNLVSSVSELQNSSVETRIKEVNPMTKSRVYRAFGCKSTLTYCGLLVPIAH